MAQVNLRGVGQSAVCALSVGGTLVGPVAQWLPTDPTPYSGSGERLRAPIDRGPKISVGGVGAAPEAIMIMGPPCQWAGRFLHAPLPPMPCAGG
jgi:hypothetical protein